MASESYTATKRARRNRSTCAVTLEINTYLYPWRSWVLHFCIRYVTLEICLLTTNNMSRFVQSGPLKPLTWGMGEFFALLVAGIQTMSLLARFWRFRRMVTAKLDVGRYWIYGPLRRRSRGVLVGGPLGIHHGAAWSYDANATSLLIYHVWGIPTLPSWIHDYGDSMRLSYTASNVDFGPTFFSAIHVNCPYLSPLSSR